MEWRPNQHHKEILDYWFDSIDRDSTGLIGGLPVVAFLKQTNLSRNILRVIWDLIDTNQQGKINRSQFYKLIRLVMISINIPPPRGYPSIQIYNSTIHDTFPLPNLSVHREEHTRPSDHPQHPNTTQSAPHPHFPLDYSTPHYPLHFQPNYHPQNPNPVIYSSSYPMQHTTPHGGLPVYGQAYPLPHLPAYPLQNISAPHPPASIQYYRPQVAYSSTVTSHLATDHSPNQIGSFQQQHSTNTTTAPQSQHVDKSEDEFTDFESATAPILIITENIKSNDCISDNSISLDHTTQSTAIEDSIMGDFASVTTTVTNITLNMDLEPYPSTLEHSSIHPSVQDPLITVSVPDLKNKQQAVISVKPDSVKLTSTYNDNMRFLDEVIEADLMVEQEQWEDFTDGHSSSAAVVPDPTLLADPIDTESKEEWHDFFDVATKPDVSFSEEELVKSNDGIVFHPPSNSSHPIKISSSNDNNIDGWDEFKGITEAAAPIEESSLVTHDTDGWDDFSSAAINSSGIEVNDSDPFASITNDSPVENKNASPVETHAFSDEHYSKELTEKSIVDNNEESHTEENESPESQPKSESVIETATADDDPISIIKEIDNANLVEPNDTTDEMKLASLTPSFSKVDISDAFSFCDEDLDPTLQPTTSNLSQLNDSSVVYKVAMNLNDNFSLQVMSERVANVEDFDFGEFEEAPVTPFSPTLYSASDDTLESPLPIVVNPVVENRETIAVHDDEEDLKEFEVANSSDMKSNTVAFSYSHFDSQEEINDDLLTQLKHNEFKMSETILEDDAEVTEIKPNLNTEPVVSNLRNIVEEDIRTKPEQDFTLEDTAKEEEDITIENQNKSEIESAEIKFSDTVDQVCESEVMTPSASQTHVLNAFDETIEKDSTMEPNEAINDDNDDFQEFVAVPLSSVVELSSIIPSSVTPTVFELNQAEIKVENDNISKEDDNNTLHTENGYYDLSERQHYNQPSNIITESAIDFDNDFNFGDFESSTPTDQIQQSSSINDPMPVKDQNEDEDISLVPSQKPAIAQSSSLRNISDGLTKPTSSVSVLSMDSSATVSNKTVSKLVNHLQASELEKLSQSLFELHLYDDAYHCLKQASIQASIANLNRQKKAAIENDELEVAVNVKRSIQSLSQDLLSLDSEQRWQELVEVNKADSSLDELVEVIDNISDMMAEKCKQRFFHSIPKERESSKENILKYYCTAKRSIRLVMILLTTHMNYPNYWKIVLQHILDQIKQGSNSLIDFEKLSPDLKSVILSTDKMKSYIRGLLKICQVGMFVSASCIEAMVRESLAMEVVQSVQLFIDSAAEPWNMLEEGNLRRLVPPLTDLSDIYFKYPPNKFIYCNITLRPIGVKASSEEDYTPLIEASISNYKNRTYLQPAINLWLHELASPRLSVPESEEPFQ